MSLFQRIWLVDQQRNGGPLQATFATFRLDGPLNIELTERVLGEIWCRHEMLRATIRSKGNRPHLWITADSRPALPVVNLEGLNSSERAAAVERVVNEAAVRQIDLTTEQAARVMLVRLERNLHLLLLTAHPIACDAISVGLFGVEFTKLYEVLAGGGSTALPERRFQYREFFKAYRRWLREGSGRSDITYWRTELAGLSGPGRDFGDQAPFSHPSVTVGAEEIVIPASLCQDLRRLAEDHSVDLETTFLAVFQVLLHRYSGDDEVPVGVVVSKRRQPEVQRLIGCLVNYLVLRARFSPGLTFAGLLAQAFACRRRADEHSTLSLQTVLKQCLEPGEVDRHGPTVNHRNLFRAVFSMRETLPLMRSFSDLMLTQLNGDEPLLSCDLALSVTPDGKGLAAKLGYNRAVFSAGFAARMSRHFINALTAAVEKPNLPVERLPLMDAEERRQVTVEWNDTAVGFRQNVCLHELFEAQAERTP